MGVLVTRSPMELQAQGIVQLSLMRKECFCNNTCIDILLVNATKREI